MLAEKPRPHPPHVRNLWGNAARTADVIQSERFKKIANAVLIQYIDARVTHNIIKSIDKGGVITKSKKLYPIHSVTDEHGNQLEEGEEAVAQDFRNKWGCSDQASAANIQDLLHMHEHQNPLFTANDYGRAFSRLKKKFLTDATGISVAALEIIFIAHPVAFVHAANSALSRKTDCQEMHIQARAHGKTTSNPKKNECRAILPLSAIATLFDAIISDWIHNFVNDALPALNPTWEGARPATQCLDVACTMHIALEKMLESQSHGAIVTVDIQRYYDNVNITKCYAWLIRHGACPARAACMLRIQMLPKVFLHVTTQAKPIENRTLGSLTGSRTAGACGRIPWADATNTINNHFPTAVWKLHGHHIPLMTWIDNAFLAANTPQQGIYFFDHVEEYLQNVWDLTFKPSSKQILLPKGCEPYHPPPPWTALNAIDCLGYILDSDGSTNTCWKKCTDKSLGSLLGKCRTKLHRPPFPQDRTPQQNSHQQLVVQMEPLPRLHHPTNRNPAAAKHNGSHPHPMETW